MVNFFFWPVKFSKEDESREREEWEKKNYRHGKKNLK